MADYRFLTTWLLDCPRERVFEAIHDQESWPQWWRGMEEAVELRAGDGDGVGALARQRWRSRLPYRIEFEVTSERVERPHLMVGRAVGELNGTGIWRIYEEGGMTAAVYEWNVATTKAWMNLLAPVARPVFKWNHDWLMQRGGEGIADLLGCRLLAIG